MRDEVRAPANVLQASGRRRHLRTSCLWVTFFIQHFTGRALGIIVRKQFMSTRLHRQGCVCSACRTRGTHCIKVALPPVVRHPAAGPDTAHSMGVRDSTTLSTLNVSIEFLEIVHGGRLTVFSCKYGPCFLGIVIATGGSRSWRLPHPMPASSLLSPTHSPSLPPKHQSRLLV